MQDAHYVLGMLRYRVLRLHALLSPLLYLGTANAFEHPQAYVFRASELNQRSIAERIASQWKKCEPSQIEAAKLQISVEKRASDSGVQVSDDWLRALRERRQVLLRLADATQLEARIKVKEQGLDKIREEARKGIAAISFKAVYAVILRDSSIDRAKKRDLQSRAQAELTSQAVPEQRGMFLSSETVVQNSFLKEDRILMESSGEVETEEEWLSHPLRSQGKFLYLAKVQVRPLSGAPGAAGHGQAEAGVGASQSVVLDMSERVPEPELLASGLSKTDIQRFHDVLPPGYQSELREERVRAERQIRSIEANRRELEAKLSQELSLLRQQSDDYRRQVSMHLRWLGKVVPSRLGEAYAAALDAVDAEILNETARKVEAKEMEPVAVWKRIVPSQNSPDEDIAQSVLGTVGQLQQAYGSLQRFLQVSEVRNSVLTRDESFQWQDWYRSLDRIEVLVVPRDDNDYHVSVIAWFSLNRPFQLPKAMPRTIQPFATMSSAPVPDSSVLAVASAPVVTESQSLPPVSPVSLEKDAPTCRFCWLAGGLAVGAGATAAVLLLTEKDSKSTASVPASSSSSVEATW